MGVLRIAPTGAGSVWSRRVADAVPVGDQRGTVDLLSDPRLLVVAPNDDRIGALCRGLDGLGWRTMTARTGGAAVAALGDFKLEDRKSVV